MYLKAQEKLQIENLIEQGVFKYVDFAFAEIFAKEVSHSSFYFLSYLFALGRLGHHSVLLKDGKILPDVLGVFPGKEMLISEIIRGAKELPSSVCQTYHEALDLRPVVKENERYSLQKYFVLEKQIAKSFTKLIKKNGEDYTASEIENALQPFIKGLNREQILAIKGALQNQMYILSGGPGTGKTYTIEKLLCVYLELLKDKEPRILALAPTGKATAHLKEKLGKISGVEIKTLHSALKLRSSSINYEHKASLGCDLVIVDECSMIDLHVWKVFFSSILENTKVVLVGDYHQLPPVETGMIFEELFLASEGARMELKECVRIKNQDISAFSDAILQSDLEKARATLQTKTEDFSYFEFPEEKSILTLDNFDLMNEFNYLEDSLNHIEKLLEGLAQVCILTPVNKGIWGVKTINEEIYSFLRERAKKKSIAVPIMITQTDYGKNLYNGDLGILIQDFTEKENEKAFFLCDGVIREFKKQILPNFEYAYCVSVHKVQGSEFDKVILFLPEKSEIFGKELLYTALTRAKYRITMFAKEGVLEKCFSKHLEKGVGISRFISLKGNLKLEEKV